jgi:hypothetical protein
MHVQAPMCKRLHNKDEMKAVKRKLHMRCCSAAAAAAGPMLLLAYHEQCSQSSLLLLMLIRQATSRPDGAAAAAARRSSATQHKHWQDSSISTVALHLLVLIPFNASLFTVCDFCCFALLWRRSVAPTHVRRLAPPPTFASGPACLHSQPWQQQPQPPQQLLQCCGCG